MSCAVEHPACHKPTYGLVVLIIWAIQLQPFGRISVSCGSSVGVFVCILVGVISSRDTMSILVIQIVVEARKCSLKPVNYLRIWCASHDGTKIGDN